MPGHGVDGRRDGRLLGPCVEQANIDRRDGAGYPPGPMRPISLSRHHVASRGPRRRPQLALAAAVGLALVWACAPQPKPSPHRHLILITVDTLRADRLAPWGGDARVAPRLNALASESVVFERAYAPASFTLASMTGMLTSRYPEEVGIERNVHQLGSEVPTLADALAREGFRTAAVVSNFALRREAGLAGGFEVYDDAYPQRERVRRKPERVADHTTDAAIRVIDGLDTDAERVFLWVHYQDPHGPYTPPADWRDRYLDPNPRGDAVQLERSPDRRGDGAIPAYQFLEGRRDPAWYVAGYDGEVGFADLQIGRLLDSLRERELLEESVVVFTADHGEGLGEHDYWFAHGEHLTDPLTRVPLMIRSPVLAPTTRADLASLLDVWPTVAGLLGVAVPDGLRGRDLTRVEAERVEARLYLATLGESRVARRAIVTDGYKLITTGSGENARVQLFRLGDEARDVAAEEPGVVAELSRALHELHASLGHAESRRVQALTEEDRRNLEALGYLDPEDE